MFRFDIVKPEIREIIQEKEVSKESLSHVFFYNLLELERLRGHLQNLEIDIELEKDLYTLLKLGERRDCTGISIEKRKEMTKRIMPLLVKVILDEYLQKKGIDKWDSIILFREKEIKDFLSGKIRYNKLIKNLF
ncbi:hypothetical protein KAU13_04275 [candidate division WOR-3 bacterium]|nr:hypothetical protein [candidate division WOR-3 bacterium]